MTSNTEEKLCKSPWYKGETAKKGAEEEKEKKGHEEEVKISENHFQNENLEKCTKCYSRNKLLKNKRYRSKRDKEKQNKELKSVLSTVNREEKFACEIRINKANITKDCQRKHESSRSRPIQHSKSSTKEITCSCCDSVNLKEWPQSDLFHSKMIEVSLNHCSVYLTSFARTREDYKINLNRADEMNKRLDCVNSSSKCAERRLLAKFEEEIGFREPVQQNNYQRSPTSQDSKATSVKAIHMEHLMEVAVPERVGDKDSDGEHEITLEKGLLELSEKQKLQNHKNFVNEILREKINSTEGQLELKEEEAIDSQSFNHSSDLIREVCHLSSTPGIDSSKKFQFKQKQGFPKQRVSRKGEYSKGRKRVNLRVVHPPWSQRAILCEAEEERRMSSIDLQEKKRNIISCYAFKEIDLNYDPKWSEATPKELGGIDFSKHLVGHVDGGKELAHCRWEGKELAHCKWEGKEPAHCRWEGKEPAHSRCWTASKSIAVIDSLIKDFWKGANIFIF